MVVEETIRQEEVDLLQARPAGHVSKIIPVTVVVDASLAIMALNDLGSDVVEETRLPPYLLAPVAKVTLGTQRQEIEIIKKDNTAGKYIRRFLSVLVM